MKPKEIRFVRIYADYNTAYDVVDRDWHHIGRVEVDGGRCRAWCYDTEFNEVYCRKVRNWWSFDNSVEEFFHLRRIRRAMAEWWSEREKGGKHHGA